MQKITTFSALFLLFFLAGCGKQTAVEYNDVLVELTKGCLAEEVHVWEALAQQDVDSSKDALQIAKTTCEASKTTIDNLGGFDGNSQLESSVSSLLSSELKYLTILESVLSYNTDASWTDAQEKAYLALQEELATVRAQAITQSEQVVSLQKQFAEKYNFIVEESFGSENAIDTMTGDGEGMSPEESTIEMD